MLLNYNNSIRICYNSHLLYDCPKAQVSLPSRLQSLTFGFSFNESLERVALPGTLRHLTFGNKFNRSLEEAKLDRG